MKPIDDIEHQIDRDFRERRARVRQMVMEAGRPDVLAEFDADMRNLDLGITTAQATWHSISAAQARTLAIVGTGRVLRRHPGMPTWYDAYGEPHAETKVCSLKTARALCARDLLHVDGGALDPESKFVITERGRFVLRHGYLAKMW